MCPSHDKAAAFLPTCQRLPPQPVLKYQHPNPVLTSSSKTLNTQECLPFLHFSSARFSSTQPKGVRMWFPEVICEVSRTPGCSFEIKNDTTPQTGCLRSCNTFFPHVKSLSEGKHKPGSCSRDELEKNIRVQTTELIPQSF